MMKNFIRKLVHKNYKWSIGIYEGKSPFHLKPAEGIQNPVLTAQNVNDVSAEFVADPFMVYEDGTWYMFFEVFNKLDRLGSIAFATSEDGLKWHYERVVLNEPFHLSYPYIFKWNHEYYMIPETYQTNSVRLYRATSFPTQWTFEKILLQGHSYVDSSISHFNNCWWLFVSTTENSTLRLYYADVPQGPWIEHPKSPLIKNDASIARPGGRVIQFDQELIRFTQDCRGVYGRQIRAFAVKEITTTEYREELIENTILQPSGSGWNKIGMHNIDPYPIAQDRWLACVDGYYRTFSLRPGIEVHY